MSSHFGEKGALAHVLDKKEEIHGSEVPGFLQLAYNAAEEISLFLVLGWIVFSPTFYTLFALCCGLIVWKTGRAANLAWSRLERFHRLVEQEKYEIEHHRPQERDELVALYSSKGFQGKLLDDVVDTLMADQDRLLKVMLEEEMGLTLEAYEHPLKQALGTFLGAFFASALLLAFFYFLPSYGIAIATLLVLGLTSLFRAKQEDNRLIAALIWSVAIGVLSFGIVYFLLP